MIDAESRKDIDHVLAAFQAVVSDLSAVLREARQVDDPIVRNHVDAIRRDVERMWASVRARMQMYLTLVGAKEEVMDFKIHSDGIDL